MTRWFDAVAPVHVEIGCGGHLHRITWQRGKVVLRDHSLREEEALLALGGPAPPCVEVMLAWRDGGAWEASCRPHPPGFARRVRTPSVPEPLADVRRLGVVRRWERKGEVEDVYRMLRRRALPRLQLALESARRRLAGGPASYAEVRLAGDGEEPGVEGRIDGRRSAIVVTLRSDWLYTAPPTEEDRFPLDAVRGLAWRDCGDGAWEAYAS